MTELQQCRLRVGLSQLQAAAEIDVDPRTLRAWELGERRPWPGQRKVIARVYDISMGDLHNAIEATMAAIATETTTPRPPRREAITTIVAYTTLALLGF